MPLNLNHHAAAYGLFQIVFASLDTQISQSLVELMRAKNTTVAFALVSALAFQRRLKALGDVVKLFEDRSTLGQEVYELREACKTAEAVSVWRNARIHARVRFVDESLAIIGKDGQLLPIDHDLCEARIQDCIKATVALEAFVPHLVGQWKFDEKIEVLFADET